MDQNEFRDKVIDGMARLETKLDSICEKDKDKEKRLRSLEKRQWAHSFGVTLLAALLAKFGIPLPGSH